MVIPVTLELVQFDGRESHELWLRQMERLALAHESSEDKKLRMAIISLRGPALACFDALRLDERALTWEDFLFKLQKKHRVCHLDWEE